MPSITLTNLEFDMSASIRASHILLMYAGSANSDATRSKAEALGQITELKDAIVKGADFADLARQISDCPSGEEGGDLGHFSKGEMVPEFDKVAFDLKIGTVSDVVETSFGYHLIQRTA